MWEKIFAVYIMTNVRRGVLYVGVASNLISRAVEHRDGVLDGFTKRYQLKCLVWCADFGDVRDAIELEKKLRRWRPEWKFRLIEEMNPEWDDLLPGLMGTDLIGPLSPPARPLK
jgi:putative endonuclease